MTQNPKARSFLQVPYIWAFTTYFAEGFPYTIIRIVSSVFFRDLKVSLEAIGLTSLFGMPWVLKFLWGPQIDQFGTKRRWMLSTQAALILLVLTVAYLAAFPDTVRAVVLIFFVGSFIAATHDMAIDGYYMEALTKSQQAKFVGYRVMAYRISMMAGTGIIVSLGTLASWRTGFLCAGSLLGLLLCYHILYLPKAEIYKASYAALLQRLLNCKLLLGGAVVCLLILMVHWTLAGGVFGQVRRHIPVLARITLSGWVALGLLFGLIVLGLFKSRIRRLLFKDKDAFYTRAFLAYMDREKMGVALAFIILMRTGESMLASMASPFMVDLGIKTHFGWISGGVGLPFSIIGAMLGGWCISHYTLKKTIWPFLLAQNITNLVYMALALHLQHFIIQNTGVAVPQPIGSHNLFIVASVHAFDQFAGGLGTSVLMTFLMRTCTTKFKAAHFAIGSGLMNISGVLAGVISGFLAHLLGYGYFFGISFLASLPGMALIPFVPFLGAEKTTNTDDTKSAD
jgi:PAT family beta-lactamase induction signal transducer AmpG